MMLSVLFRALKTLNATGGDIVNYLAGSAQRCLPPVTNEILLLSATELASRIRKREISSEEVVRAFIDRARVVQFYLNAIIDERFDDAIRDAQAIDEFLKTTSLSEEELAKQKPLLGLPFTTKDSVQVSGMKWSSGCLRRKDIISDEDAPVVKNFRKAGAIPIALTNVPELLLWFATSNKLYGTTNNPFDLSRTPGGSSGGEAALTAACGSPLSICSDIGGSIRMPAFYCGLFGHKPTHEVVDYGGTFPEIRDGLEKLFSFGPISRYVDDLILSLKAMAGENASKFKDLDKPVDLRKLRVFFIADANNSMSTKVEPYIGEVIRQAAYHFERKFGCPVHRAEFKYFRYISLWYTLLFSNNQHVSSLITENTHKINPFFELCKSAIGQSNYSPSALTVAAAQEATQATCSPESQPELYQRSRDTLEEARKEFNSLMGDDGILIYVTLPRTAPTHYASLFEFTNVCCPMVMNYLGVPSTQVPTGLHEGLPFGIQIAAAPFNDRLTIAAAKELERLYGGWIKPFQVALDEEVKKLHRINMDKTRPSSSPTALSAEGELPSSNSFESVNSTVNASTPTEAKNLPEPTPV